MGIQRPTRGPKFTHLEMVDRSRWTHQGITHRYINIARRADIKIKSVKVQFLGVQHA